MSRSLRFLGVAVAAWAGIRAVSLGMVPGTGALAVDRPATSASTAEAGPAALPRVETTDLTPPELATGAPAPVAGAYPAAYPPQLYDYPLRQAPPYGYGYASYYPPPPPPPPPQRLRYYIPAGYVVPAYPAAPAYAPAFAPRRGQSASQFAELNDYPGLPYTREPVPPLDDWPLSRIIAGRSHSQPKTASSIPAPRRFDRLELSSWAMLRQKPGPSSLAANGLLGGSQAGMRLLYRVNRPIALSLRVSSPLGSATRGGEAALGLRYQPFASIPVSLTAERRQAFGKGAGRSAFALFAEGGLWQRPIAAGFNLDAYLQGGVVGTRHRDLFVDGAATLTRPLWRNFSVGAGAWGGMQPGLSRLDVGPRLSMKLGRGMRVHLDYRYKALGNAQPGSGAVVTVAGDF